MIAITLPWPPRSIHPNARAHWGKKASDTKHARKTAGWCAREAGLRPGDPDIPANMKVTVVFYPPDAKVRDRDNLLANCKAYFDGIADALGVNDSGWDFTTQVGDIVKKGAVRVELEAA